MKSRDLKNLLNSAAAALEDLHADLSDRDKVCLIEDLRAEADEMPECSGRHILIYGNPVDGLRFAGPFGDTDEAQEHAEVDKIEEWWIGNLEPPLKKEPADSGEWLTEDEIAESAEICKGMPTLGISASTEPAGPPIPLAEAKVWLPKRTEATVEVEAEFEEEKPRVNGGVFKSILANGDSNDLEISCLQEAIDLADNLLPGGEITQKFEEGLYEILVENDYDPDEDPDGDSDEEE